MPVVGTGATLIAATALLVKSGSFEHADILPAPANNEEWAKTLLAVLIESPEFTFFDDCRNLNTKALATVLTCKGTYAQRVLGYTKTARVPVRTVWVFAGNNPRRSEDIRRRFIEVRIDSNLPNPANAKRKFKHEDLIDWVLSRRADIIAAVFTLARGWILDGCPKPDVNRLASFEEWSQTIGGILQFSGIDGFLKTPSSRTQIDEEEQGNLEFVTCWLAHVARYRVAGVRKLKAKQLLLMSKTEELSIASGMQDPKMFSEDKLIPLRDRVFSIESLGKDGTPLSIPHSVLVKIVHAGSGGNRWWELAFVNPQNTQELLSDASVQEFVTQDRFRPEAFWTLPLRAVYNTERAGTLRDGEAF